MISSTEQQKNGKSRISITPHLFGAPCPGTPENFYAKLAPPEVRLPGLDYITAAQALEVSRDQRHTSLPKQI